MAKPAVTEYEVIESAGGRSLLKIRPKTGRTHQIRVHLASIGHPIIGDVLYGRNGKSTEMATRLMLHAGTLAFEDGDGSRFEFEAPLPGEFRLSTGPRS
jgi:23S rRNA-/tRNA-specific pseudouridylate synthase